MARAGDRLVAVGPARAHRRVDRRRRDVEAVAGAGELRPHRGVSSSSDSKGWAVGHDGVILHTRRRRRHLAAAARRPQGQRAAGRAHGARGRGRARVRRTRSSCSTEAKRYKEQGADKPFLDVWFADANNGYVVGAYNLIFRTADGGKTWEPWFDRTDNPKFFNLYAIRPAAGGLYIAGEGGLVLKLDAGSAALQRAARCRTRAASSASPAARTSVLVFGLRGNVFRSDDGGRTWAKVDAGLPATIVGGDDARRRARLLLADAGGRIVASDDGGRTFKAAAAQATDAADRPRRRRQRPARARRAARRRRRRDRGALTRAHTATRNTIMAAASDDLDQMPVVRKLADFDRNSGNLLERLVFNNRLAMMIVCAIITVVLGYFAATKLVLNASFEKMIPQSQPYIKNYLTYQKDLRGLGNAIRVVVENTDGDIFDPQYLEVLKQINDELFLTPGVDRAWVKSLWTPGGALDRGDRGRLSRRPGDAGHLRRLAAERRAAEAEHRALGHRRQPRRQQLQVEHDLRAAARQGAGHRQAHRLSRPVEGARREDPRQVRARQDARQDGRQPRRRPRSRSTSSASPS